MVVRRTAASLVVIVALDVAAALRPALVLVAEADPRPSERAAKGDLDLGVLRAHPSLRVGEDQV